MTYRSEPPNGSRSSLSRTIPRRPTVADELRPYACDPRLSTTRSGPRRHSSSDVTAGRGLTPRPDPRTVPSPQVRPYIVDGLLRSEFVHCLQNPGPIDDDAAVLRMVQPAHRHPRLTGSASATACRGRRPRLLPVRWRAVRGGLMAGQARRVTFGLDVFGLDDRMRLFGYVTADNRLAYLWVLRAFDAARANYHVLLHTSEVTAALAGLHAIQPDCPDTSDLELARLLDALVDWGVLDRSQDGTRAATLAEYRNRHSVYQFTEAGYRAHRAVDRVLSDIAERAARFYHMLGDLSRTNDVRPETFLAHKDALLAHLRDFHDE